MSITTHKIERVFFNRKVLQSNGTWLTDRSSFERDCIRTSESVANWRQKIRSKQNATGPYVVEHFNLVRPRPLISSIVVRKPDKTLVNCAVLGDWATFQSSAWSTDFSRADTLALQETYKRLEQASSHANGMQFLGELDEVIRQFRRPYRAIVDRLGSYLDKALKAKSKYRWHDIPQAKRKKQTKKLLADVADSWLETVFGLKPLISDVKDLAEAAARFENDSRRVRIRGRAQDTVSGEVLNSADGTVSNYIILNTDMKILVTHRVQYVAALDHVLSADFGSFRRAGELAGFRLDKVIPTIYELIPYSFLVDYVSNLGNVIEAGCMSQASVKYCVRTVLTTCEQEYVQRATPSPTIELISNSTQYGSGTIVRKKLQRSSFASLPQLQLMFSLPGKKMQYANILALWSAKSSQFRSGLA